jgi:phenylalanyl-tRNA synthetase beta chain
MRVSLRWLADYIDLPTTDPQELRQVFASLGHEVEGVDHLEVDWQGVVVARVDHIRPHPAADKVRLCMVNTGQESIEVVCGAWNFDEGAKVAFARPGAVLAGGFEIGRRTIRGVESVGMICSEKELGLGDDHTGILVLDPDTPLGVDFAELVSRPDVVFDLTITPNRPDAMSMVGIARELSAYFQVPYHLPPLEPPSVPGGTDIRITIADPTGCHRFVGREIRNPRIGPSPFWLRERLRAAGMRPISNVVDITNFVMLELGQPLHAFDLDKLRGGQIVVRRAHPGELLTTLDGVERKLDERDLVVADAEVASGLAGTMGGEDSEVGPATGRVLLEAAAWDPPTIMHMSRRHGLRSEASARFERGVDPNLPPVAAARAARLAVEIAGAVTPAGWIDEVAVTHLPLVIELPLPEITRVLGDDVPVEEAGGLLARLHLGVMGVDPLEVTVPTYRPDLTRPIDLIEEIARLHGFDRFQEKVPAGPGGGWTEQAKRQRRLRSILAGAGLSQALNLSFLGAGDLDAFAYPADHPGRATIAVTNPLNDELASLRTALLPGVLRSLRYNLSRGQRDVALFEIGKVFSNRPWSEDSRVPAQPDRLAFAVIGGLGNEGLGERARSADVFTATAIWRLIAGGLGIEGWRLVASGEAGFHPGRCAAVVVDGVAIGHIGEIHPATAAAYELEGRVAAGELALAPLVEPPPLWQLSEPSMYPPIEFDLAFEMEAGTTAAGLLEALARVAPDQRESMSIFDDYRGPGIAGARSIAIHFVYRAPDRTLTGDDAAAIRKDLIAAAAAAGGMLRGS